MASIESIYQEKRDRHARLRDARVEAQYEAHPQLAALDKEIGLCQIARAKELLKNPKATEASVQLAILQKQRAQYLSDHRIDAAEFALDYDCALCRDYGTTAEGKKCICRRKLEEQKRYGQQHLQRRIETENFETFDLRIFDHTQKVLCADGLELTERENIEIIRRAALRFVENFDDPEERSMLFYGGVGLGKSFLCYAIAKALIDKGRDVRYLTMNELVDLMQLYTFDRDLFVQRYQLSDYYALEQCELLIIDDLGKETATNSFVKSMLFHLVNARMISGKKMLISTNLQTDALIARYDDSIASRLASFTDFYYFFGSNKRWQ